MLKQGIYEHIINQETDRKIQEAEQSGLVCVQQPIDSAESPQMLANYLANAIRQKLEDTEEQQDRVNLITRKWTALTLLVSWIFCNKKS